ncbi:MAG: hypothetical protein ABJP34_10065 [Erythrobacter sp.]
MKTTSAICRKKKRFQTRDEAEASARDAPFKLRAYTCGICGKFHLTSRTKGMKTPRSEIGA